MTALQRLRLLIRDREKVRPEEVFGVGTGTRTSWVLEMCPIKNESESLTAGGVSSTNYTINNDTGLITYDSAPSDGDELLATVYSYYAFSDTELNEILVIDSNVLLLAAASCLRILAADSVKLFAWWSGSERVDMSKISASCLKAAKSYEDRYDREKDRAKAVPASGSELWEVVEETFGEQLDLDLTEYLDDSV